MSLANVTAKQQTKALTNSTLAFTVCFAVWTIFSIIGIKIKQELGLSDTQFGILVATPILTGSLSRIFLGIWSDQYGGRIVYTIQMLATAVAAYMLTMVSSYGMFLLAALGVGLAGGGFSVGITYVSKWYPQKRQGTALGKAAVYKHIPVYYPDNVGSVGGIVGLIGGLGGFVLPITFGVMNDLIGVWTSCFMLLTVITAIALVWMHVSIGIMDRKRDVGFYGARDLPEMEELHGLKT